VPALGIVGLCGSAKDSRKMGISAGLPAEDVQLQRLIPDNSTHCELTASCQ
jgi:hypothetical protein